MAPPGCPHVCPATGGDGRDNHSTVSDSNARLIVSPAIDTARIRLAFSSSPPSYPSTSHISAMDLVNQCVTLHTPHRKLRYLTPTASTTVCSSPSPRVSPSAMTRLQPAPNTVRRGPSSPAVSRPPQGQRHPVSPPLAPRHRPVHQSAHCPRLLARRRYPPLCRRGSLRSWHHRPRPGRRGAERCRRAARLGLWPLQAAGPGA